MKRRRKGEETKVGGGTVQSRNKRGATIDGGSGPAVWKVLGEQAQNGDQREKRHNHESPLDRMKGWEKGGGWEGMGSGLGGGDKGG